MARYIDGTATDEDLARVRAWLASGNDLSRRRELAMLRQRWERAGAADPVEPSDVNGAWQAMVGRMDVAALGAGTEGKGTGGADRPVRLASQTSLRHLGESRRARWRWLGAGIAAAAVAALVFQLERGATRAPADAPIASAPSRMTEVVTKRGQRAQVQLADGSIVSLNVASRLRYASDLGAPGAAREVELEGEAFFDVVHDSTRPFVVRTAHGVARDLGTKFAVAAYQETRGVTVVVAEGIVALTLTRSTPAAPGGVLPGAPSVTGGSRSAPGPARDTLGAIVLHPADLGRAGADGRLTMQRGVDVTALTAWLQDRLVFHDTPLRDAVVQLSRWYDADVRVGDPAIEELLLSMPSGADSFAETITMVGTVLQLRVVRNGRTVTFYARENPGGSP